ncbi:MAG TPA: biopolymer transporter ExbD [Povalibacter sp.]|nr:biopolymer transporter ExbD [Povalibacter sp.]
MAISTRMGDNEPIAEMNTTPLIDVLLVLLIMFVMTMPLMTHSTTLDTRRGPMVAKVPETVYVDIDFDGVVLWNGSPVSDLQQLEDFLRVESGRADQPDVQVRPDRRATYDTVAHVLAIAQRTGMRHIGVGTRFDD